MFELRAPFAFAALALVGLAAPADLRAEEPEAPAPTAESASAAATEENAPSAPTDAAPATPTVAIGPGGLRVTDPSDTYALRLGGFVQTGVRAFPDDRCPAGATCPTGRGQTQFLVRRARPDLRLRASLFEARIFLEVGSGTATLLDAYIDARVRPALTIRVGRQKGPVGFELLQAPTGMAFLERSLTTMLVPNREVGVTLFGHVANGVLGYHVGVYNGAPDGGGNTGNVGEEAFDLAARVSVRPRLNHEDCPLRNMELGGAVTFSPGGDMGVRALPGSYRAAGGETLLRYADDVTPDGGALRATGFLYAPVGGASLLTDVVYSQVDIRRGDATASLGHLGWMVGVGYAFGGDASAGGVRPHTSIHDGGLGALELKARVSALRFDDASADFIDTQAESALEVAGGIDWWFAPRIRWMNEVYWTNTDAPAATETDEIALLSILQLGL